MDPLNGGYMSPSALRSGIKPCVLEESRFDKIQSGVPWSLLEPVAEVDEWVLPGSSPEACDPSIIEKKADE
jgi:hypothetical protein